VPVLATGPSRLALCSHHAQVIGEQRARLVRLDFAQAHARDHVAHCGQAEDVFDWRADGRSQSPQSTTTKRPPGRRRRSHFRQRLGLVVEVMHHVDHDDPVGRSVGDRTELVSVSTSSSLSTSSGVSLARNISAKRAAPRRR